MDEYLCRTAFTPYYPSYLFLSFLHKSALSDKQGGSKKYSFHQVTFPPDNINSYSTGGTSRILP